MLKKLYVHNYKSLQNFEFDLKGRTSIALLGKNGSGKSSIGEIIYILQQIGNGINDVNKLFSPEDISYHNKKFPIIIQVETTCEGKAFKFKLALEYIEEIKHLSIKNESLKCEGEPIYTRDVNKVSVYDSKQDRLGNTHSFLLKNTVFALPILQSRESNDPIKDFKEWLGKIIILSPVPSLITGISSAEAINPNPCASNLADWITNILGLYPRAYNIMDNFLQIFMHDFKEFYLNSLSKDVKEIIVTFGEDKNVFKTSFNKLSDGEKCFFIGAALVSSISLEQDLLCFWDEPDSYLGVSEIQHFITTLRKTFSRHNQIIITSHNNETLRTFSDEDIYIVQRENHLMPTAIKQASEFEFKGNQFFTLRQIGEI